MEEHTRHREAAGHVQAPRTHPEGHGESVVDLYNWGFGCVFISLMLGLRVQSWCLSQDKLALNITTEQGKTLKDAQGDVFRGLGQFNINKVSILI